MSRKIKVRDQKGTRSLLIKDMVLNLNKGVPMRDRRDRRPKDARRNPINEWD